MLQMQREHYVNVALLEKHHCKRTFVTVFSTQKSDTGRKTPIEKVIINKFVCMQDMPWKNSTEFADRHRSALLNRKNGTLSPHCYVDERC